MHATSPAVSSIPRNLAHHSLTPAVNQSLALNNFTSHPLSFFAYKLLTPCTLVNHTNIFHSKYYSALSEVIFCYLDMAVFALINVLLVASMVAAASAAGNFNQNFDITWGDGRAKILNNGQLLTLSLDKTSGSGFRSKNEYLFGKIDLQIKLVPGNSAGTVTTYYLSSEGPNHDEIDFEFLGNVTGQPYTLHTNVFAQGKGAREQQFRLWFDPTADFHTYSILWNPQRIIFTVDGTPIREFRNWESIGVPFPKSQAMKIYSTLWDAEDWATQGGRVKTDWSKAPFTASYRNFNANACVWSNGRSSCRGPSRASSAWMNQQLDATSQQRLRWVQKNFMIYNYCTDIQRFPQGLPKECTATN